ncbi:hypothetical protein F4778DRAFT_489500 [Xylariomycetidae sp. FL2044]|nr:hypothetical protein F4778DRAFT_489500 [Xylariomycetidae sp. FL2044]
MDHSSTASVAQGDTPAKETHKFSSTGPDRNTYTTERVNSYMSTSNGGGNPVTALHLRNEPAQASAARSGQIVQEMNRILAQYGQH